MFRYRIINFSNCCESEDNCGKVQYGFLELPMVIIPVGNEFNF